MELFKAARSLGAFACTQAAGALLRAAALLEFGREPMRADIAPREEPEDDDGAALAEPVTLSEEAQRMREDAISTPPPPPDDEPKPLRGSLRDRLEQQRGY